jgi:hypothetical protein
MAERRDPNLFEILIGQVTQNIEINIILGKSLSVLPDAELFEPVCNLLHRRPSTIDLVQICIMAGTRLRELARSLQGALVRNVPQKRA